MESKRLFLLDAYALIFRAYYALIRMPRITRDGFNTSAIFGFVNTLEELLSHQHPTHLAVCFDPSGPTFRSEAYADYKGEREATPEDIKLSVPIIKEILNAYNIPILEKEGFEADDVIGTMAVKAEAEGFTTYMMTPDKDFGQLVTPAILQFKPSYRGQDFEIRGVEEIKSRYSLHSPSQVIDLLALMGDKIDNIPGCPGVGEKTAIKLIAEFGSAENLIANSSRLKGALKKKVEDNAEQIIFSKYLATIRTDVPLEARAEDLKLNRPDTDKLYAIFDSLEFRTLKERVQRRLVNSDTAKTPPHGVVQPSLFDFADDADSSAEDTDVNVAEEGSLASHSHRYSIVNSEEALSEMQQVLSVASCCSLVLDTEGDNDMALRWTASAVAVDNSRAWYIPTNFEAGKAAVLDLMTRPDIRKITDAAKTYMVVAFCNAGSEIPFDSLLQNYTDITLAHYLLQPDLRHNIDMLADTYLRYKPMPPAPAGRNAVPQSPDTLRDRLCEKADVVFRLLQPLEDDVKQHDQWALLNDIELPLSRVLAKMETTGVCIDEIALNDAAVEMEKKIAEIEREIFEIAGEEFNVGSPAKVGEILFDKMHLDDKAKKTKTGQYSTSETQLEKIAHKNPIVSKILEFRRLKKLLNTYLTALPQAVNPSTGRIHTNYNQTVTATGRISSSNPNLQNIPVREDVGREIRRAFIPSEGNLFYSADYSQIELRLVADFANDATMLDAFNHGEDIHAITAAKIYHKDVADVSADERRHAKTANFGILYGITAFGLASRLGIPRSEAKDLIDNYFKTFPSIYKYMSDSVEKAREKGYASTHMGRRRLLPDINSKNPVVRGYAERNAINAPVQGSAADIIKRAMIDIDAEITRRGLKSRMIMQVHDELNFDVIPEELAEIQELVSRLMEHAYSGRVTLVASGGVASNWLDAH